MRKVTIYASKTGVEITPATAEKKKGDRKVKSGRVRVRAFHLENGSDPVYVFLTPQEGHKLGRYLEGITTLKEAKRLKVIIHKTEKKGSESLSTIEVERWESKDKKKSGYALIVQRDKNTINVPMDKDTALYLADFLKALAIEQSWEKSYKMEETAEEEEVAEEVVEEGEDFSDLEEAF
ncbi:hypothetical protein [Hydrogenivirga sp.]